jgi:hypothetical protein
MDIKTFAGHLSSTIWRIYTHIRRSGTQLQLFKRIKQIMEHRKGTFVCLLAFLAFGQMLTFLMKSMDRNFMADSFESALLESTQMSDKSLRQFMLEKGKDFAKRRKIAENVCENLKENSPKYKPRNATINFDILWDHHYQVSQCNVILLCSGWRV